ncbi:hypothetical protein PR001_g33618, partial [Phytophthora rubi]
YDQEQQPAADEPMGSVEGDHVEDTEMPEAEQDDSTGHELATYRRMPGAAFSDNIVFHPEPERVRRAREPVLVLEDGRSDEAEYKVNDEDDPDNDDHF